MASLFTPLQLGALELPNRILMAPLTRARAGRDGVPTELMARYYAQRAGAGLIISEATGISREGLGWPNAPGLWNQDQVDGWKPVTDAVHREGGRIVAQLWHMGRLVHPDLGGGQPVSSSATTAPDFAHTYEGKKPYEEARAATEADIGRILDDYASAARNAIAAGFDGVQIHGANGYLVDQFLRDSANFRDDDYGGADREPAALHAARCSRRSATRSAWTASASASRPTSWSRASRTATRSRFIAELAKLLEELRGPLDRASRTVQADFVRLDPDRAGQPGDAPASIRGKIVINSDYDWTDARHRIEGGNADAVSIGRLFIANPDLVTRIALDAPLNYGDQRTFYSGGAQGYIDYPTLGEQVAA